MNSFSGIGRIGRDAVTRHTSNGKPVTGWALAIDSGFGENKKTTWIDCSLWGDRGAKVAEYIVKGQRLGVTGEIGTREHDGKTYVTLNVHEVTLLGDSRSGAGSEKPARAPQQPQRAAVAADEFEDSIPFSHGDA